MSIVNNTTHRNKISESEKNLLKTMFDIYNGNNNKSQAVLLDYNSNNFEKYKIGITKDNSLVLLIETRFPSSFPYECWTYEIRPSVRTYTKNYYSVDGLLFNINPRDKIELCSWDIQYVMKISKKNIKHLELS